MLTKDSSSCLAGKEKWNTLSAGTRLNCRNPFFFVSKWEMYPRMQERDFDGLKKMRYFKNFFWVYISTTICWSSRHLRINPFKSRSFLCGLRWYNRVIHKVCSIVFVGGGDWWLCLFSYEEQHRKCSPTLISNHKVTHGERQQHFALTMTLATETKKI